MESGKRYQGITHFSRSMAVLPIGLVLLFFFIIILRRAWVSDDAYITFRTVDNLINGYRLTWNTAERVQAYTHPLWMLVVSLFYAITREIYFTSIILSLFFSMIAVGLYVTRLASSTVAAVTGVVILGFSNAFVDYSTSGLENPLTHLILACFFLFFFNSRLSIRNLFILSLLASLGVVNRMDTILFYIPPLLFLLWQCRRWSAVLVVVLGQVPFILWEIFSIFYYGFPFPNTAYAKLNISIPASELWQQGFFYLQDSLIRDPVTLLVIMISLIAVISSRNMARISVSLGVLLYILYVLNIGGDFMSGRFLAAPFFWSVVALTHIPFKRFGSSAYLILFVALGLVGFSANPPTILIEGPNAKEINEHGITNERLYYFEKMGLMRVRVVEGIPQLSDIETGLRDREASREDYYIQGKSNVGVSGFYAGPNVHYIDMLGLTDPLLARLPPVRNLEWRIGHFHRVIPRHYVESIYHNQSLLEDKDLAEYYEVLRIITRGNLFDPQRLVAIWKMNSGQYEHLIDFERYHLPDAVELTLSQVEKMGSTFEFEDDGILVDLEKVANASKIRIRLENKNGFILSFRRNREELATLEIFQDHDSREMVQFLLDVPLAAQQSGYDSIRILPTTWEDSYQMGGLQLLDLK